MGGFRFPGIVLLGFVVARRWAYQYIVCVVFYCNIYYDHINYITSYILIKTPTYDFQWTIKSYKFLLTNVHMIIANSMTGFQAQLVIMLLLLNVMF